MDTNVAKKIINSNGIVNGSAIATTTVKGEFDKVNPVKNKTAPIDCINDQYTGKFDDSTYYTN